MLTGPLHRLTRRLSALAPRRDATPPRAPCRILDLGPLDDAVYAVGDVHGCRAALARLIDRIRADAAALSRPARIILLGDMIDRGPDAAGVIELALQPRPGIPLTAVLGNHERLMLDFTRDPHGAADWLDLGGFETLRSYGLSLTRADLARLSPRRARQVVEAHLPDSHLHWLAGLPHGIALRIDGQAFLLTHAGYDTARPPDRQDESTLLWGRGGSPGGPDLRLVQGHLPVDRPDPDAPLVRLDTGAWRTGRLTCLRLCGGHPAALLAETEPTRMTDDRAGKRDADRTKHLGQ